jgi:hypothetical protein
MGPPVNCFIRYRCGPICQDKSKHGETRENYRTNVARILKYKIDVINMHGASRAHEKSIPPYSSLRNEIFHGFQLYAYLQSYKRMLPFWNEKTYKIWHIHMWNLVENMIKSRSWQKVKKNIVITHQQVKVWIIHYRILKLHKVHTCMIILFYQNSHFWFLHIVHAYGSSIL